MPTTYTTPAERIAPSIAAAEQRAANRAAWAAAHSVRSDYTPSTSSGAAHALRIDRTPTTLDHADTATCRVWVAGAALILYGDADAATKQRAAHLACMAHDRRATTSATAAPSTPSTTTTS